MNKNVFKELKMKLSLTTRLIALFLTVMAVAGTAQASLNFDDIQFWVGTGENRAALVIDWNDGVNPDSLVWGYRWDETATGTDMIQAIDAADSRFTVNGSVGQYGLFVDGIRYDFGNTQIHDQATTPDWSMTWSYWVSTIENSSSWTSSWVGASDRVLVDGSCDGWSFTAWDESYNPVTAPSNPVAAVPEPVTIGLLAMGVLGVIRKRRMN
jgi:hypothetical protein